MKYVVLFEQAAHVFIFLLSYKSDKILILIFYFIFIFISHWTVGYTRNIHRQIMFALSFLFWKTAQYAYS